MDKRGRGGVMLTQDGGFNFHCFNCGFKASFVPGRNISVNAKRLLEWLGVDQSTIEHINLESLRHRSIHGLLEARQEQIKIVKFNSVELPEGLEALSDSKEHQRFIDYLTNRSIDPASYPFLVSPEAKLRNANRIVVPFTHEGKLVGYSARYLDDHTPKYINEIQHGYVFGTDLQHKDWQYAIVVEGVFDALAINGLALLHAEVNNHQVELIRSLNRDIILVPDQDKAGLKLIDRAIELGWSVSIPEWAPGIKDVNDAVKTYGKLGTLLTILEARETSKIKIELRKKKLAKRI